MVRFAASSIALCLVLSACGESGGRDAPPAGVPAGTAAGKETPPPSVEVPGTLRPVALTRVVDGDSLEVDLDGSTEEVRLLGVNAPERGDCRAEEARLALQGMLRDRRLSLSEWGRDQYGRMLAYLVADGELVNRRLLADGWAIAVSGEHPLLEPFLQAEEAAYATRTGLWAADACGPEASQVAVVIEHLEPDPPGRDEDPAAGEYLRLVNQGTEAADLSGWVVRDESSVHRYRFPTGTMLAPGAVVVVRSVCGAAEHCFGGEAVWSNGGDTALLLDSRGNIVHRLRYRGS